MTRLKKIFLAIFPIFEPHQNRAAFRIGSPGAWS